MGSTSPKLKRTADGAVLQCVWEARYATHTAAPLQDAGLVGT